MIAPTLAVPETPEKKIDGEQIALESLTPEEIREANGRMIQEAARLGDAMVKAALGGFRCYNSQRAFYAGNDW